MKNNSILLLFMSVSICGFSPGVAKATNSASLFNSHSVSIQQVAYHVESPIHYYANHLMTADYYNTQVIQDMAELSYELGWSTVYVYDATSPLGIPIELQAYATNYFESKGIDLEYISADSAVEYYNAGPLYETQPYVYETEPYVYTEPLYPYFNFDLDFDGHRHRHERHDYNYGYGGYGGSFNSGNFGDTEHRGGRGEHHGGGTRGEVHSVSPGSFSGGRTHSFSGPSGGGGSGAHGGMRGHGGLDNEHHGH